MDLQSTKRILEEAPIDGAHPILGGNAVLKNLVAFRTLVDAVEEVGPLQEAVATLRRSAIYSTVLDELSMSQGDAREVYQKANEFYYSVIALRSVVSRLAPDEPSESITVRLPEVSDLTAVVNVLGDIEKALSQLVLNAEIAGEVKVSRWETGSLLVLIYLKTLAAVDIVGRALKSAVIVYQEIQRGRLMGQQVKSYKIKNETLQDLHQAQSNLLKELISQEATAIDVASFNERDPERLERIKNSIKLLAELIERGTVIYPALTAPKEQQAVFPDFKQLGTVATAIKQIEDSEGISTARPAGDEEQSSSG